MKAAGMAALGTTVGIPLYVRRTAASERIVRLTIKTDGPARLQVIGAGGAMFQPHNALMDRTAKKYREMDRYYLGHFVSLGTAALDIPAGRYMVIVEKGLEFERLEAVLDLDEDRVLRLAPKRWVDMASRGWWSGDLHIHRPPEYAAALLAAEDLNLGAFITMWHAQNFWKGTQIPPSPIEYSTPTEVATLMNAEDERGGGAWLLPNLRKPLWRLGSAGWWYPPGLVFIDQAKAQGGWFDCEKPIWWETPVMAALERIDSLGVVHNHYNEYGMVANEAWGRPRDQKLYPGPEGFSNYSLGLYYRYLNLGHRYPASAGSASGVMPSPPGYNRVYVLAPGGFGVGAFYAALRAGRSFVTNGPVLTFNVDGKNPGDTINILSAQPLQVVAEAQVREGEAIDRVEIVANGRIVAETSDPNLEAEVEPQGYTWLAARCFLKSDVTVRLAHSSPIYLTGPGQNWNSAEDAAYFVRWIDDLIADTDAHPRRFQNDDQKTEVLESYLAARVHYESTRRPVGG